MQAALNIAAIALGSNIGEREKNLEEAIVRMGSLGEVTAVSSFHDTAPELYLQQPRFLNAAALLRTALAPLDMLDGLLRIELAMGRTRDGVPAKGPRLIDLDLLLYGSETMSNPRLVLPHPALHERRFVLAPLAEIAPQMLHPRTGQTIAQMLAAPDHQV